MLRTILLPQQILTSNGFAQNNRYNALAQLATTAFIQSLNTLDAAKGPSISEFQLFAPAKAGK